MTRQDTILETVLKTDAAITSLTASELAKKIRKRELTSVEVVEAHIKRIEEVNTSLNAVVITLFDDARAQAIEADKILDRGKPVGPLHGVPITVKEQFDIAGTETTVGVPSNTGIKAQKDGPLVSRLKKAGAIILGKTNIMMTLAGWESDNPVYGKTSNPWNTKRTPGGSSGGESSIIAAHGSPIGLGGDFGGSIRIPAHFCGLFGLKPTSWRLTNGDTPSRLFSSGQEAIVPQPGPIARSTSDIRLMMEVLADPPMNRTVDLIPPVPWLDPDLVSLNEIKIGYYLDDSVFSVSPAIQRAVMESVEALSNTGLEVESFIPPDIEEAWLMYFEINASGNRESIPRTLGESKPNVLLEDFIRGLTLPNNFRNIVAWNMERTGQKRLANIIRALKPISGEDYWKLIERRNNYREKFLSALDKDGIDAIMCPPYATVAPQHGLTSKIGPSAGSYSMLYNLLGMPAGVVPVTLVKEGEEINEIRKKSRDPSDLAAITVEQDSVGMPVGVQVVARHWREDIVLRVMECLENKFKKNSDYPLHHHLTRARYPG